MNAETIFVQIPSYRDPQLIPTIEDALARARHPERLTFAVCWQHGPEENLDRYPNNPRFRILDVDWRESKGACWARDQARRLYRDETYALQIDSHQRFVQDWDEALIDMLNDCRALGSRKPVLTTYAPLYNSTDDSIRAKDPTYIAFRCFSNTGAILFDPVAIQNAATLRHPIRARFLGGGFCFSAGAFCREVPYDPHFYFFGEEMTMAVRAFTHGYDLFHPCQVVIWHEGPPGSRKRHWDDHKPEGGVEKPWWERDGESHRRNRVLLGMEEGDIDFGPYGLGSERSLRDYERYAGLNFKLRGAQPYTLDHGEPPNPVMADEKAWLGSFLKNYNRANKRLLRPRREASLDVHSVEDGYVAYHPGRDRVHFLNATAALVLELCDGRRGYREIEEMVAEAFSVDDPCRNLTGTVLDRLLDEGLVTAGEPKSKV